jgi:hypothetical protein
LFKAPDFVRIFPIFSIALVFVYADNVQQRGGFVVSRYPGKKLPPHWVYVPSPREIRTLLNEFPGGIRRMELGGTGWDCSSSGQLSLGFLERRVVDRTWCFYIKIWGVRESAVDGRRDEISRVVIEAVRRSIVECSAIPAADWIKPTQLSLWLDICLDGVHSKCSNRTVPYFYPTGSWWMSSSDE